MIVKIFNKGACRVLPVLFLLPILFPFYGATAAVDLESWQIELRTRGHAGLGTETWVRSLDQDGAVVHLMVPSGKRLRVPLSNAEAEILSDVIAPLSRRDKKSLELGICTQFIRVKTAFGSRKFCARQFTREEDLAALLSKLDRYRALTLRGE